MEFRMEISKEQRQKYLSRREADLKDCVLSLENKNIATLERIGHQMKGNGATFGFDALSDIGQGLEKAARAHDWKKMEEFVKAFQRHLQEIIAAS
jgi:HPt (histidine-containing phosphotransfer) domain-containing protein